MGKRGAEPGWGRRATEEALGGRVVGAGASASSDPEGNLEILTGMCEAVTKAEPC